MSLLTASAKIFAAYTAAKVRSRSENAVSTQQKIFSSLVKTGSKTSFGKEHGMHAQMNYAEFSKNIPVRDYEGIKKYIEQIMEGESDVLWKGKPLYLSKTSGTTSGVKYIPVTKDSIPNHITSTRNALLSYIGETGNSKFLDGKMIFLSGSPELEHINGIPVGRLSGIVNHHVPQYLRRN